MSTKTCFHGVYPILYSFFDEQGELDREAMRRQVEGGIAGLAHGIAVMGKLDVNERRLIFLEFLFLRDSLYFAPSF